MIHHNRQHYLVSLAIVVVLIVLFPPQGTSSFFMPSKVCYNSKVLSSYGFNWQEQQQQQPQSSSGGGWRRRRNLTQKLNMGLYDEDDEEENKENPLDKLPPSIFDFRSSISSSNNNNNMNNNNMNNNEEMDDDEEDDDDDEEENVSSVSSLLFSFDPKTGNEKRSMLPSLGRRLDTGIGCYFDIKDRKVQTLVKQTGCHPMDAAWALEAHKGKISKAHESISYARRIKLRWKVALPSEEKIAETDWDSELFHLIQQTSSSSSSSSSLNNQNRNEEDEDDEVIIRPLGNDGINDRKKDVLNERQMMETKDFINGINDGPTGDADYLPTKNPRPVDDEPWFTG